MGSEKAMLRVRRGEQTYGPMTLEKAQELLAKGRLQETDLVAENDGPWLPLKVWQGQRSKAADIPLFDDTPLFSGPADFDPNYVPLSDPDVTASTGTSNAAVPARSTKPVRDAKPETPQVAPPQARPLTLEGSGELKADDEPAQRRSTRKSGTAAARPSSGGMKARPSSASMPAAPSVDESGLDALLQSLAENERKAPPVTPGRTLPPRDNKR